MSQTAPEAPAIAGIEPASRVVSSGLWRAAGGFALAHVVLIMTGIALLDGPLFADGTAGIQDKYAEGDMARTMAGGMVEVLGFVLLIPALVFLARAIGRRTEVARWATQTALMAAMAYVAVTMAVGFPAGAAALYGAQHGLDVDVAFAINNIRTFGYFLSLALLGAHAVNLAVAAQQDRTMTRWVGWGGLFTGLVLFASVPLAAVGQQDWPDIFGSPAWMFGVVTLPVPVAVAVALLQRRLYDVQLVANRTATFVGLSVAVASLYAATVGGVGLVLHDRGAVWLPWAAAGVVAVAFAPLRNALQRGVNRLTYGQWSKPGDVLAATGRRLADAADVPVLLQTLTTELGMGLGLAGIEVVDVHGRPLAVHGDPHQLADELPLTAYGQQVGALRWGPASTRDADRRLMADLAGHLGGVVHSAGLVEDLRQAQERLVVAREEERRRLRRDLHDGLGPALAGLTLQVDTVRNLTAAGSDTEDQLLELRSGVASTVLDVRRIVEGLRPPALDELGLDGALVSLDERIRQGSDLTVEVTMPADLPDIPAAVEVAAYRVTQEALSNAVRHSGATHAQLALVVENDGIHLEVTDNGSGKVRPRAGGIGLTSMHERAAEIGGRLSIQAAAANGTTVSLWLPRSNGVAP